MKYAHTRLENSVKCNFSNRVDYFFGNFNIAVLATFNEK